MKIIETFIEILSWLKIVASPTILGCLLGLLCYKGLEKPFGICIGILIALIGLIIGVVWATRIWKTQGASTFMSRVNASPDLDDIGKPE